MGGPFGRKLDEDWSSQDEDPKVRRRTFRIVRKEKKTEPRKKEKGKGRRERKSTHERATPTRRPGTRRPLKDPKEERPELISVTRIGKPRSKIPKPQREDLSG